MIEWIWDNTIPTYDASCGLNPSKDTSLANTKFLEERREEKLSYDPSYPWIQQHVTVVASVSRKTSASAFASRSELEITVRLLLLLLPMPLPVSVSASMSYYSNYRRRNARLKSKEKRRKWNDGRQAVGQMVRMHYHSTSRLVLATNGTLKVYVKGGKSQPGRGRSCSVLCCSTE